MRGYTAKQTTVLLQDVKLHAGVQNFHVSSMARCLHSVLNESVSVLSNTNSLKHHKL